jgi:hypothetical protein
MDTTNGVQKYDVVIDRDYMNNPDEIKYALNSFVKEKGGTSYDAVKHGMNDYYVTIPGKTPVEDLPEIKHFHKGRTITAIVLPSVGAVLLLILSSIIAEEGSSSNRR